MFRDHLPTAGMPPSELLRRVLVDRAEKDIFFRSSLPSPIPREQRAGFAGLTYYAVDLAYRFEGLVLIPGEPAGRTTLEIPTSDGQVRLARRAGTLRLTIEGQEQALHGYDLGNGMPGDLFVPFLDATSGNETYGAGRYLDLEPEPDGTYVLDFNVAYFPWCAYSPDFSCPLTPSENRLPVPIRAGERLLTVGA